MPEKEFTFTPESTQGTREIRDDQDRLIGLAGLDSTVLLPELPDTEVADEDGDN